MSSPMVESRRDSRPITVIRELVRAQETYFAAQQGLIASFGLQESEFDLIATLGNTEGMRMGDVAGRMLTSAANVTRIVKKLEARGLVTRRRSDHCEREVIARLTKEGEALFARAYPAVCDAAEAYLDARLTHRQQDTLIKLLSALQRSEAD